MRNDPTQYWRSSPSNLTQGQVEDARAGDFWAGLLIGVAVACLIFAFAIVAWWVLS